MATSDDFREELKAGNFGKALKLALSEAIELQITTWVVTSSDGVESKTGQPGYRMRTRINIVDGDIDNEVGSQFLSNGPYTELRQFHIEQVQQGRETIQKNLQGLQKIFSLLLKVTEGEPETEFATDFSEDQAAESPSPVSINAQIIDEPLTPTPPPPIEFDSSPVVDTEPEQPTSSLPGVSPEIFADPPTSFLDDNALGDLTLPEDAPTATIASQPIMATSTTALLGTAAAAIAAPDFGLESDPDSTSSAIAAAETDFLAPDALGDLDISEDSPAELDLVEAALPDFDSQTEPLPDLDLDALGELPLPDETPLEPPVLDDFANNPFSDTTEFALGGNPVGSEPGDVETALNSLFPDSAIAEAYPSTAEFPSLEEETTPTTTDLADLFPETVADPIGESEFAFATDPTAELEEDASIPDLTDLLDAPATEFESEDAIAELSLTDSTPGFTVEDPLLADTDSDIPNPYATDPITNLELEDSLSDLFTPNEPVSSDPEAEAPDLLLSEEVAAADFGLDPLPDLNDPEVTGFSRSAVDLDLGFDPAAETDDVASLFADSEQESDPLDLEPEATEVEALSDLFAEPVATINAFETTDFGSLGPEDLSALDAEPETTPAESELADLTNLFAEPADTPGSLDLDESPSPDTEAALANLFTEPDAVPFEPSTADDTLFDMGELNLADAPLTDDDAVDLSAAFAEPSPETSDAIDESLIGLFTEPEATIAETPGLTLEPDETEAALANAFDQPEPGALPIPLSELFDDSTPDASLLFAEAPAIDPNLSVEESLAVLFKDPSTSEPELTSEVQSQEVPEIDEEALSALFADTPDTAYSFTVVSETSEEILEFPPLLGEETLPEPEEATNPFADFLSTTDLPLGDDLPNLDSGPDIPDLLPPPTRKKRDENNQKSGG